MAGNQPFDQLIGPQDIWIAPYGEAVPVVNVTPAGNWYLMGATTGDQTWSGGGDLSKKYDNDNQGPVKSVVPQEDPMITFTLASQSQANFSRILNSFANVTTDAGPPSTSRMPLQRGYIPTEYAVLFRGDAFSDFGAFPGMFVLPFCAIGNAQEFTIGKDQRAELEVELHVFSDPVQAEIDRLGWHIAQVA